MSTYISGGCKNGKSFYAQRVAMTGGTPLYYVATMIPRDGEDLARIRRHRDERAGWDFETLECGRDILSCLDSADPKGSFLLDSVTALLSNEMFSAEGRDEPQRGQCGKRSPQQPQQRAHDGQAHQHHVPGVLVPGPIGAGEGGKHAVAHAEGVPESLHIGRTPLWTMNCPPTTSITLSQRAAM